MPDDDVAASAGSGACHARDEDFGAAHTPAGSAKPRIARERRGT